MQPPNRPIRTLLFSTLFPSSTRPAHGIFVEARLRELLRSGRVVSQVIAPVPWFPIRHSRFGDYARMAATPAREMRHGIQVMHPRYLVLPKIGMSLAPLTLALSSVGPMRRLVEEFDLIDAHYFYPDGVAAALLAKWFDKPLAITARGTDLNLIPRHAVPRRLIQWAARQADASIGVCAALIDVLRPWGIPESRLHVFRNGVDLERFSPHSPEQARASLGLAGSPVLLSVGHLVERKGHHLVVEAMPRILRRHPNALLIIAGDGAERRQLIAQVRSLGLSGRVLLVGAIPNERLAIWYSAADVLVLASSREGWANVLLESMACGTPVVATRIWGTPEVVRDDCAGLLIDERSATAVSAGVLNLLARKPDRSRVRAYAEGFSWDQTTKAQIDLFARMLAGENQRPGN